jgi:hypothetical protein
VSIESMPCFKFFNTSDFITTMFSFFRMSKQMVIQAYFIGKTEGTSSKITFETSSAILKRLNRFYMFPKVNDELPFIGKSFVAIFEITFVKHIPC